jgi:hypothetical protein
MATTTRGRRQCGGASSVGQSISRTRRYRSPCRVYADRLARHEVAAGDLCSASDTASAYAPLPSKCSAASRVANTRRLQKPCRRHSGSRAQVYPDASSTRACRELRRLQEHPHNDAEYLMLNGKTFADDQPDAHAQYDRARREAHPSCTFLG